MNPPAKSASPAAHTGQATSTAPAVKRKAPPRMRTVAAIAVHDVPSWSDFPRSGCAGGPSAASAFVRTETGEPDAEKRAAPLGQERLDTIGLVDLDGIGDLGGRVARLGKGGHELLVQILRGRRRLDAHGELGARVQ
jgi:hypothetical protein